jgi:hypothetical protein
VISLALATLTASFCGIDHQKYNLSMICIWYPLYQKLWGPAFVTNMKSKAQKPNVHCCWTSLKRKINKIIGPSTPQGPLILIQLRVSYWNIRN